uniref:RNA-directed RNA polymerase n=1 Tax=Macrophomina phaseolina umbra-like virus 1 TaxID=2741665 RepID=A0A7U3VD72_9TOMB|nr:RNA-dependent RNA polymerase [Macrophomina phaseolina umbra-like virus 1]
MADCWEQRRFEYRCWTPQVEGVWHPQVHRSCAHNASLGLQLRTLGLVPGATESGRDLFRRQGRLLRNVLRGRVGTVLPWTHEQVVESYSEARMRLRYGEALASLRDAPISRRDARVAAFVKAEKLANYKVHKPRVIMGRSPRYNLELASFLKPLEHELYPAFRGWGSRFLTHTRLIGKGLSGEQRAVLLRRKMQSHSDVVAFEVDCKSFESHLDLSQLDVEHGIYNSLVRSPGLQKLLSWQKEFSGAFRSGVRFRAKGVRASGDFNTGLGNTLIMCCLVMGSAERIGTPFDFLADGDNAVVFVRGRDLHLWQRELSSCFLEMGHEAEIGEVQREIEGVTFGQSKPVCVAGRWTMVRDPLKVLSHAFAGHQHYAEMSGGIRVLRATAYCEATLNRGVPVLQEFAHAMLRRTRGLKMALRATFDNYEYRTILRGVDPRAERKREEIAHSTRCSFERAWGIPIGEQLRLEAEFARVKVDLPATWEGTPIEATLAGALDPWQLPMDEDTALWITRWS